MVSVEPFLDGGVTEELHSSEDDVMVEAEMGRHGGGRRQPATNLDGEARDGQVPTSVAGVTDRNICPCCEPGTAGPRCGPIAGATFAGFPAGTASILSFSTNVLEPSLVGYKARYVVFPAPPRNSRHVPLGGGCQAIEGAPVVSL